MTAIEVLIEVARLSNVTPGTVLDNILTQNDLRWQRMYVHKHEGQDLCRAIKKIGLEIRRALLADASEGAER